MPPVPSPSELRAWDHDHVWHPFAPMQSFRQEAPPIIAAAEGFELIDVDGRRYLDGISSLWCNVHGHRVPEIDAAIRQQLDAVAHTTLLGLSSVPSIQLARELVRRAPAGLNKVFYSDSGATAVEAALKIVYQYQRQRPGGDDRRRLFATVRGAYHGDTLGSVSVGAIDQFHRAYGGLLFETVSVPAPVTYRVPPGYSAESWLRHCFDELERTIVTQHDRLAGFILEPLVQGAAGILVHPPGYLRRVRELTRDHGVPLIADEVAVGFGRTGRMFACEHEAVTPDVLCLAKGITGGYLPLAATLTTDAIYDAFLGDPAEGRTFFHGHTYTGNPLACAAALASLDLFDRRDLLRCIQSHAEVLATELAPLREHPHVGEIRQCGIMVGIELVADRTTREPFSVARRTGHRVTLAAREQGVIVRPLGDVVVLMPAPAMPPELLITLCRTTRTAVELATA